MAAGLAVLAGLAEAVACLLFGVAEGVAEGEAEGAIVGMGLVTTCSCVTGKFSDGCSSLLLNQIK